MRNPSEIIDAGASSSNMTKTPRRGKIGVKRGPWNPEEDKILTDYVSKEGVGKWNSLPKRAGLLRCGKSCRLRWMNYLRPSIKRGFIAPDEEDLILRLHRLLGNRWALIAGRIPGRTDNEIKNYWNTHLSKKLISQGIDPRTHKPLENWNSSPSDYAAGGSSLTLLPSHGQNPNPTSIGNNDSGGNDGATASAVTDHSNLHLQAQHESWKNTLENGKEDVLSSFLDSLMTDDEYALWQLRDAAEEEAIVGYVQPAWKST
ncbi:hypothetical protein MLD38_025935 [Melastoma candidum]|uniref:Uncharacterized protein n=1 Tax=Melastoma candidum TaxID=119954 RepID=A0ACB9P053_9MYRT|nr:hypothetical protein MLD38_025935 [Melastoma candidum]